MVRVGLGEAGVGSGGCQVRGLGVGVVAAMGMWVGGRGVGVGRWLELGLGLGLGARRVEQGCTREPGNVERRTSNMCDPASQRNGNPGELNTKYAKNKKTVLFERVKRRLLILVSLAQA